jgi:MFS family permease
MMLFDSRTPSTKPGEWDMANSPQQMAGSAFTKKQTGMAISAIYVGYFVYSYFMQTLNNAAPRIAADLKDMALLSWSVSIPSLGLAIGTLLGGKLSDIYGRRALLMGSMIISLLGSILSGCSTSFIAFIGARTILNLGLGIVAPLCFTVIGDIFPGASERGKWIGLLNIPMGLPTLFGPTLGGWFVDNPGWRHIFWWSLPLIIICVVVVYGMPSLIQGAGHKIDVFGAMFVTLASSALIFGLSFAGTTYPWGSVQVVSLLGVAILFGVFFLLAESKAQEPFLHLDLFKNRTFMTASIAGFLSFFGMTSITLYFPLLMQGVQGKNAMLSGMILTPFGFLMALVGVTTGFIIARTKRYKPLIIAGYAIVTAVMIGMIFFDKNTPVYLGVTAVTLAGLGLGVIPTINTLLIQAAVPRKLMGSAMAVLFFSISIGMALAPAVQGSALNVQYNSSLKTALPEALTKTADKETLSSLSDPRVLLSADAMKTLRETLVKKENGNLALFEQTVEAIRSSEESGLKVVFIMAAITMALAFLLICSIPVIPMDRPVEEKSATETVAA